MDGAAAGPPDGQSLLLRLPWLRMLPWSDRLRSALAHANIFGWSRRRIAALAAALTTTLLLERLADKLQRMLLYHPHRPEAYVKLTKLQVEHAQRTLPKEGYTLLEFSYTVASQPLGLGKALQQRGLLLVPSSGKGWRCLEKLWVIFGGNAMIATDWLPWMEHLIQNRGAAIEAAEGSPRPAFLLMNYPGYGDNEGAPSRSFALRCAEVGVRSALEQLRAAGYKAPQSLAYLGHSLGAAAVTQLAVRFVGTRPKWLGKTEPASQIVMSAPFTSIPKMGLALFGQFYGARAVIALAGSVSGHAWDNERSLRELARISSASKSARAPDITMFLGHRDEIVPVWMPQALHKLAHARGMKGCTLIERPQAGHNDLLDEAFAEFVRLVWALEPGEPSRL